ncbi:hypothetical protein ABGV42_00495 [Paenibacillus pabuli]|uniref:hypothetical protein n=1 Tax=Paenibacillus pabuli TaxID=1472 RepID=UPI0032422D4C
MEQASIKSLVRLVMGAQDFEEFSLHLRTRGASEEGIQPLWEHYMFLLKSSFLSPWVSDCLMQLAKLDETARKYEFTTSKVRTDVYRTSQAYSNYFPFDIFELAFTGGITEDVLTDNKKIMDRLWKKYKPVVESAKLADVFAVDIMEFIDRPEKHTISDEEFDELRAVLSRLSKEHLRTLLELTDSQSLRYGLYLLTGTSLDEVDGKRSSLLKDAVGLN